MYLSLIGLDAYIKLYDIRYPNREIDREIDRELLNNNRYIEEGGNYSIYLSNYLTMYLTNYVSVYLTI
jgi:hypothetical protein